MLNRVRECACCWIRRRALSQHSSRLSLCSSSSASNKSEKPPAAAAGAVSSELSHYNETYKKLDNLDFMTAANILFSEPPKKKKFGLDFHLVQLFFACLPSLAVYLVAQYARAQMKGMDAELEKRKRKQEEEEKAKESGTYGIVEDNSKSNPELLEVKVRLDKLEEAVKEIAVESKKQSTSSKSNIQEEASNKKQPAREEQSRANSNINTSIEKDNRGQKKEDKNQKDDPK